MPQYDVNIILNPNLEPNQLQFEKDMIQQALERFGAEVKGVEEWGNRRLAYPIQKDTQGYYLFYTVELEPAKAKPLENELRVRDNVRRVLIVRDRPEWKTKKA